MFKKLICVVFIMLSAAACSSARHGKVEPGTQSDLEANVGDYVLFSFDSSSLEYEANETLAKQVDWLKKYSFVNVIIEGRCDERGTREYNLALGERRANSARQFLISSGISPSRIKTISYGKERPIVMGSDEYAWKENRRASTVVD
jgi:peptidoglycan-associated lipoprotein